MGLGMLLLKDPAAFFLLIIPLLYSVIFHEMAHGWIASLFGDDTARRSGRLSLNPLVHLDPVGTLALLLVGFGWAKPVPVNYGNLKHFRAGLICVSLAGCVANIVIAVIALILLHLPIVASSPFVPVIIFLAKINIILAAFNLIPIPPLDGSRILLGLLPPQGQMILVHLEPYGLIIVLVLLATGIINPLIVAMQKAILLIIGFILSGFTKT